MFGFVISGLLFLAAAPANAQSCTLHDAYLDRGETKSFLLCGDGVTPRYTMGGLQDSGLEVPHQQYLRRCAVEEKRPGVYFTLRASDQARSVQLVILDGDTGEALCPALLIEVPDRVLLSDAELLPVSNATEGTFLLEIASSGDQSFSGSCGKELAFPADNGFSVTLLALPSSLASPEVATHCDQFAIRVPVRIREGQQRAAKVIVPQVRSGDGSVHEGVSYIAPLVPEWIASMPESEAKFTDIAGIRTRYFDKGQGEAVLLVHGGQPSSADASAWDWQQNFDALAEHFHVYAIDKLGQGYSDNPADLDEYSNYYPRVVEHVYGFIEAMGLSRVHLVGHSQGGWPVTRIALDHPEKIASLVLVDSTMMAPAKNVAQAVRFYIYLSEELHPLTGDTPESTRRLMELFSYTGNNITEQRVQRSLAVSKLPKFAEAQHWFESNGMSPAHPAYRALKQEVWADLEAGRLKAPTLVVWGFNDPEGSFEAGLNIFTSLSTVMPKIRFYGFARSGHVPFIEYPDEFNKLISAFFIAASANAEAGSP